MQTKTKVPKETLEALMSAYNYESREGHEKADRKINYITSIEMKDGRIYDLYRDSEGEHWFKIRFRLLNGRVVSEEEFIFGHKSRKKRNYKKMETSRKGKEIKTNEKKNEAFTI